MKFFHKYTEHSLYDIPHIIPRKPEVALCSIEGDKRNCMHYNYLPYDAEIEYLRSTGTQYIDTEYIPNANTQLYIEFSVVSYNTTISHATAPFGARMGWQNKQFALFCPVNSTKQSIACYGNATKSNSSTNINLNQKYICDVNKTTWILKPNNGTNIISNTFTETDTNNLPNLTLWLFNYNNNNSVPVVDDNINIYSFIIKENDNIIMDLIPVRVGTTGYMYDRVSGKLYGNSGSGDFTLGQDIVPIKYLQATGTQFINTGIIPDVNTGIQISYSGVYQNNAGASDFYIVGLRNDSGNTRWSIGKSGTNPSYYYGYGSYAHLPDVRSYDVQYTISLNYLNNRKLTLHRTENINLEYEEIDLPNTLSFTPAYNIRIFGSAGVNNSTYSKAAGKMHFVKISQGSNLIMELIPVRIGTIGYLFNKTNRQLYGNDGSDAFTLGPDIT